MLDWEMRFPQIGYYIITLYFLDYLRDYSEFVMADSSSKSQIDSEYLTHGGQSLEQKLMIWIMLKKLKYDWQIRSGNQENRCSFIRDQWVV